MRVKLLKLELQDGSKVKATADIQLGSLLVIRGVKLVRVDSGRLVVQVTKSADARNPLLNQGFRASCCFKKEK